MITNLTLHSFTSYIFKEHIAICHQYDRYLYKTNSIVFSIWFAVQRTTFHLVSMIISKVSSFTDVVYFPGDPHFAAETV